jgi:hypothetical protein
MQVCPDGAKLVFLSEQKTGYDAENFKRITCAIGASPTLRVTP